MLDVVVDDEWLQLTAVQQRRTKEAMEILAFLFEEAATRNLTEHNAIRIMHENIEQKHFAVEYYLKMWSDRLRLPLEALERRAARKAFSEGTSARLRRKELIQFAKSARAAG